MNLTSPLRVWLLVTATCLLYACQSTSHSPATSEVQPRDHASFGPEYRNQTPRTRYRQALPRGGSAFTPSSRPSYRPDRPGPERSSMGSFGFRPHSAQDLNRDGMLSEAEFLLPVEHLHERLFLRLDRNGDMVISVTDLDELANDRNTRDSRRGTVLARMQRDCSPANDSKANRGLFTGRASSVREQLASVRQENLSLDLASFTAPAMEAAEAAFIRADSDENALLDKSEIQTMARQRREQFVNTRETLRNCVESIQAGAETKALQEEVSP